MMRMSRSLLGATLLAAALAHSPARADDLTVAGAHLVLTLNGASDVRIATSGELHGQVRITGEDAGCLSSHEGGGTVVLDDAACGSNFDNATIIVPRDMPLTLSVNGSGNVTLGDSDAPVAVSLHGSGDFHAGDLAVLNLSVFGSGDSAIGAIRQTGALAMNSNGSVKIQRAAGIFHAHLTGSGDLAVGTAATMATDVEIDGSGDVSIGAGSVGALHARVAASGDLIVGGTALTADLTASGGGDIRVADVSGPVTRRATGGSSITTHSGLASGIGKIVNFGIALDDDGGALRGRVAQAGGSTVHHVLAGIFVLFVLFLIWRSLQRRGGVAALRAQLGRPGGAAAPAHPGVIAVRETLARLDGRLARVESYVTEREFELHRKFRDLETRP